MLTIPEDHAKAKEEQDQANDPPPASLAMCLYPEQLVGVEKKPGNFVTLTKSVFEKRHGPLSHWLSLVALNLLQENRVGQLNLLKRNDRIVGKKGSYDGIDSHAFSLVVDAMSEGESEEIFKDLCRQGVLVKKNANMNR